MCSREEKNFPELLPISDKYSFKWEKLIFEDEEPFIFHDTTLNLENKLIFDLWENSFDIESNVHICDHLRIHYKRDQKYVPFILKIENINGVVQRGRDLKRINYFNPSSLIQTGLIFDIFARFEDKIYDVLKISQHDLLDSGGLIRLKCSQRLPKTKLYILEICLSVLKKLKRFSIGIRKDTVLLRG